MTDELRKALQGLLDHMPYHHRGTDCLLEIEARALLAGVGHGRHSHPNTLDKPRPQHDAESGLRPEADVAAWTHEHPHGPGHPTVEWLLHPRDAEARRIDPGWEWFTPDRDGQVFGPEAFTVRVEGLVRARTNREIADHLRNAPSEEEESK